MIGGSGRGVEVAILYEIRKYLLATSPFADARVVFLYYAQSFGTFMMSMHSSYSCIASKQAVCSAGFEARGTEGYRSHPVSCGTFT